VAIPRVIAWSCVPLAGEDSAGPAGKWQCSHQPCSGDYASSLPEG
jgi:hypothetical protein